MAGRRMTIALSVIVILAAVYAGILMFLWRFQERIVFQPPRNPEAADSAAAIGYRAADGIELRAYIVEPDKPGGRIVLAFHGNADIARWMIPWAHEVARRFGATVVIPEYRGYDDLAGAPTYSGAGLDAEAAFAATSERFQARASSMVYYGHSLGTAIASELAVKHPPAALLLESPFTSARDMAARMRLIGLGWFWGAVSRVHYETITKVRALDVPVSVAHGDRDVIIPLAMGRAVYDAARRKGDWLLVRGAGHNDVAAIGGDAYWRWIEGAVRSQAH